MNSINILPKKERSFFRLPFQPGTFKLSMDTLNKFSGFRRPKHPYLQIKTRKIAFDNVFLTVSVILEDEVEETVCIRVKPMELEVGCSVNTDETYLSRHAYFALCHLLEPAGECDFDDYYWPDFFDKNNQNKFLERLTCKEGGIKVGLKPIYHGLYKPGKYLAIIKQDKIAISRTAEMIPETLAPGEQLIGYCLLDTGNSRWHTNHISSLIAYNGVPSKDKKSVKWFNRYILNPHDLPVQEFTAVERRLIDICFLMRELTPIQCLKQVVDKKKRLEKQSLNKANFKKVFILWHEAFSLLQCNRYTHYHFTYGMHSIKGKPVKMNMSSCIFSSERPELCFSWKEKSDYYKLELRFKIGSNLYELPYYFNASFFVVSAMNPRKMHLLNSIMDCEVLALFAQTNYRMLFLKVHYEIHFRSFVDQFRDSYEFINK